MKNIWFYILWLAFWLSAILFIIDWMKFQPYLK